MTKLRGFIIASDTLYLVAKSCKVRPSLPIQVLKGTETTSFNSLEQRLNSSNVKNF